MFVCSPQIKRIFYVLPLLFVCVFLNLSCNPTTASINNSNKFFKYKITEAKFNLGSSEEFDFINIYSTSDGNGRLLVQYQKKRLTDDKNLGSFLRFSDDGGETFGEEYEAEQFIKSDEEFENFTFHFVPNGLALTLGKGKNFFYAQSDETLENWNEPNQVNDEQDSILGGVQILQTTENEVFCVWTDNRRGFALTYFSSSNDGGKTWSPNQPIDYDFREGGQQSGKIVQGENGRLHVVWQDWRDRKTLVDIRYSYSDDKGVNWSESIKINNDEKEVWQMAPKIVADGANIYVAFADFREQGEEDDNDWNIYFARSRDNGNTWDKNKRLNDIKEGIDWSLDFSIDKEGNLYCVWESGRETLFGQTVFSYSNDKGDTWSPSIPLTTKDEIVLGNYTSVDYIKPGKLLVRMGTEVSGEHSVNYAFLKKTKEEINSVKTQEESSIEPLKEPVQFKTGKSLFAEDFSGVTAENWEVESGFWDLVGGTYMGVYPNQFKPFVSYAKFQEPETYVLKGRFRLDKDAHTAAMLHFRSSENGKKKYVIVNHFRVGTWLSVKELDVPEGGHLVSGRPIVQKRYPFRQDRWYKFTLVVAPKQIDYYVNGRLMLSYKGEIVLPIGKIGIGGYTASPTYFDDIEVLELKR